MLRTLLLGTVLLEAGAARAAPPQASTPQCRARQDLAGACFPLRGALLLYNGAPSARIRVARTRRLLGVAPYTDADDETFSAPADLRGRASFEKPVAGRFTVCPLSPSRAGRMQTVCVEAFSPDRR